MKLVVYIFFVLVSFSMKGQGTADNYFKEAAKNYVLGNNAAALQIVDEGLSKYPSDKKLRELKKKIEEKKNENKKDDKKDKNKDKKDDKKDENKDKKDDKKGGDKDKKDPNKGEKPDNGQPKPTPGGMTKERLQNLMDAVNNEEKKIQGKVNANKVKGKPVDTEKDW
ncbi:MAG: hypothetical protein QG594_2113 [Bacteroidota bacterium]|nr:hypothetical protein [Bacteroidota bacterium]